MTDILLVRIIPALAGNTVAPDGMAITATDHPRAGGEHDPRTEYGMTIDGSSPRWRGTPSPATEIHPDRRIIPALAGNTE